MTKLRLPTVPTGLCGTVPQLPLVWRILLAGATGEPNVFLRASWFRRAVPKVPVICWNFRRASIDKQRTSAQAVPAIPYDSEPFPDNSTIEVPETGVSLMNSAPRRIDARLLTGMADCPVGTRGVGRRAYIIDPPALIARH